MSRFSILALCECQEGYRRVMYLDVLSLAEMPWICYNAIVAEHRGFQISSEASSQQACAGPSWRCQEPDRSLPAHYRPLKKKKKKEREIF